MVRHRLVDDRVLDDQVRPGERRLPVALFPLPCRLGVRHAAGVDLNEVRLGPLEVLEDRGVARLRVGQPREVVPVGVCGGATRPQAVQRVQYEGQRLEVDVDRFDRRGGDLFGDRSHREHRLTLVVGLVGQARLPRALTLRHLFGAEDIDDSVHRERPAHVDPAHATVRHRAQ